MQDVFSQGLKKLKRIKMRKNRMIAVLLVLSLVVSLDVFWALRRPGWTLAGNADCNITEHTHDASCETPCPFEEHVHSLDCYSDNTADVETQLDWQQMFAKYPYTGNIRTDLVGIAKTQVGYSESQLNFEVGDDGIRRGYTRYGAWYGSPYSDWSAMFVSFCLDFANADLDKTPINTGALSMAEAWKKLDKYAPVGTYKPMSGDLVFFKNNTVGIVTEVNSATFYVIHGDVNNAVQRSALMLTDECIAGWGVTEGKAPESEEPSLNNPTFDEALPDEPIPSPDNDSQPKDLLDISKGPAVFIFEGGEEVDTQQKSQQTYSLRNSRAVTDLIQYLTANKGNYFFTLLDRNNHEMPKDDTGNYIVHADTPYKLTVSFSSPNGFHPGTYQYQVPHGLLVDGGQGTFVLNDGTYVGDWVVTDEGLITMTFNENINNRTEITISATMGIRFQEQEEPIDFDGIIKIKVEKPPQVAHPTQLQKWAVENANGDPTKIYWALRIDGMPDSHVIGNILSDNLTVEDWLGVHRYTESDMAAGITFNASIRDPASGEGTAWHRWVVHTDDPELSWIEEGWSYTMPDTVRCLDCGNEINLGNDGWIYVVNYTSTPDSVDIAGMHQYMNHVEIDNQYVNGWAQFEHGEVQGVVHKEGSFIADGDRGVFQWEVQTTIPGIQEGKKADYFWFIMDYMDLRDADGNIIGYITNDMDKSTVYANYHGQTIVVPTIYDATDDDPFAWHSYWSPSYNGIEYGRQINIVSKCHCTEATCRVWNKAENKCGGEYWFDRGDGVWIYNGYCKCWTETENTHFTFMYETDDLEMIEQYGAHNIQLWNRADLYNKPNGDDKDGIIISNTKSQVTVPELFEKVITHDFDGYTANYKITVNEAKLVLTNGTPLFIHDVMTDTLAYIQGSLVITAKDANGNVTVLHQDVDYTLTYDGTGNIKDENGDKVHVLDIIILHPQPVTYLLDYDATLVLPDKITEGIKYTNSATVTLWGQDIKDSTTEKVYADINISAKNFKVEMFKVSSTTGEPLAGATFGMFNEHNGLITSGVTDADGKLLFQTNVIQGIILREHVLYYIQELRAPPGYLLDDRKHWLCFCDKKIANCETCNQIMAGVDAVRIPFEQIGKVDITNHPLDYDLPATGGSGVYPLMLVSVMFIVTPLVYGFILRRKRGRRGVG